ncbi:amidohydrolase family protein [Parapedobacter sp. ISTM3]|uniref:amidohydrolase family protein n=1 Tax=Parapedobacter sp. ISTM3 TaxID=2800130 RepID=UPI001904F9C0|nr:amidohydrolase family protein [Parapedobacter sp. ISTM3]MBK1439161.1 amidohydrolase family protein [Parapedobacter sp. ISTM3]
MKRIDAHQHFWKYQPVRDAWITNDMAPIQCDFLPVDLKPVYDANGISGCVAVQADQSEAETLFLLDLADRYAFIEGVVGWVDLQSANVSERLAYFSQYPKLKGFRHIVQGEEDPRFLLRPAFLNGIEMLAGYGYTYDILIKPHQLEAALEFVGYFPNQPFVIDHLAKPYIKSGARQPWAVQMEAMARHEHVYCKLSGMVTEADWNDWKPSDFGYYAQHAMEVFGPRRMMFGSDWPVCLVAADYAQVLALVDGLVGRLSPAEQERVWYKNAVDFYKL